jgi:hypothetical protein
MRILYYLNDNLIEVDGLKDSTAAGYADATATVNLTTIKDADGNAVTGISFPLSLAYVAASNGKFRAVIDKALVLTPEAAYTAIVDAAYGTLDGHWEMPLTCKVRTS